MSTSNPERTNQVPDEALPAYPHDDRDTVIPPKEHRDAPRYSMVQKIGAGVAAFGLVAGGYGLSKLGGGESSPTPDRAPDEASAPVTPGEPQPTETVEETPATAEAVIGEYGDSLETISVKPEGENAGLVVEAAKPIMADTPEEAWAQISNVRNIIDLSGTFDYAINNETQASNDEELALWQNISDDGAFIQETTDGVGGTGQNLRSDLAVILKYMRDGGFDEDGEIGTWRRDWVPESITDNGNGTYAVTFDNRIMTNFWDVDELSANNVLGAFTEKVQLAMLQKEADGDVGEGVILHNPASATLVQLDDGSWKVREVEGSN